jgi:hypothetical protein
MHDPQDARLPFKGSTSSTAKQAWSVPIIPTKFPAINADGTINPDSEFPVLACVPKTMILEYGCETISGKVKFEDALARLQTSHENAAIVGQAWHHLQEHYNSKSIHKSTGFAWTQVQKDFAKKAKDVVCDDIFLKFTNIRPDASDYKVVEAIAAKAIQEAIEVYLDNHPEERQSAPSPSKTAVQSTKDKPTDASASAQPTTHSGWVSVIRAMRAVDKEDNDDDEIVENSKYATAFFKMVTMREETENSSPLEGTPSPFVTSDINRLLKAAIAGKLKNMTTWNLQKDHFRNALSDKESLPYQNIKHPLNNAASIIKLKNYEFLCGPLENKTSCERISLGSFAPMEEEGNVYKDMKQNNEETNMQRQLGHKGDQVTKSSTKVF